MSDDIATWLREWADTDLGESFQGNREASLGYMAAAEIERLRAELVATRAAKEAEWERCAKYLDRAERAEAERDGLRFHLGRRGKSTMPEIVSLTIRIRELEAERDALRKDAERYRWARDILGGDDSAAGDRKAAQLAHGLMLQLSLDAAIDAALAAKGAVE